MSDDRSDSTESLTDDEIRALHKILGRGPVILDARTVQTPQRAHIPAQFLWALFALVLSMMASAGANIGRIFVLQPAVCDLTNRLTPAALASAAAHCEVTARLFTELASLGFLGSGVFFVFAMLAALFSRPSGR
jgi:hypothetical protein